TKRKVHCKQTIKSLKNLQKSSEIDLTNDEVTINKDNFKET
ncbi:18850_t:CDS:1, partial [Racocetra fulgida]